MAGLAYPLFSSTIGDIPLAAQNTAFPTYFPTPSVNPTTTALTTVGAGTITAAGIVGGVTLRSGSTSAFTDTTDTATAIIAALLGGPTIGSSWNWKYVNNTVALATLAAGSGVTLTGAVPVPPNSSASFLVTYTGAGAVTMVLVDTAYFPHSGTFTALTGGGTGNAVTVSNAAVTATSQILITLKTVGGTVSPGTVYVNTITPGTGFTVVNAASDTSVYNYTILG
jgi:hypothetical protein